MIDGKSPSEPGYKDGTTNALCTTGKCQPPVSPCKKAKDDDDKLSAALKGRMKGSDGEMMFPAGLSYCKEQEYTLTPTFNRFNKYRKALPYARAASDVNRLKDAADDGQSKKACLTRLPDTGEALCKELGLPKGTISDADLRNDKTGFRAAIYRSEADGKLILVARDTQPHSLVDWKTNTDNGQGKDTDQYIAMRQLAGKLDKKGVPFDVAGYSKGGGLAQEAGLIANKAKVYIFNSSGLPDAALGYTGNKSFASLESRTVSYSSEGDFLTYMNNTTDPAQQLVNARYLRNRLAEEPVSFEKDKRTPIAIGYRSPELKATDEKNIPQEFKDAKSAYINELDKMIKGAEDKQKRGESFRLFPPAHFREHITIDNSSTITGNTFGAGKNEPNVGKLNQHKMENVIDPLEKNLKADREMLQKFLKECPG